MILNLNGDCNPSVSATWIIFNCKCECYGCEGSVKVNKNEKETIRVIFSGPPAVIKETKSSIILAHKP